MNSCTTWSNSSIVAFDHVKRTGISWGNSDQPVGGDNNSIDNCLNKLRTMLVRETNTAERDAGSYLIDLINVRTDDEEEQLESKVLSFPAEEIFLAGVENGSDEALAKTRYLLRCSGNDVWQAWQQLANNLDIYPAVDYIVDLISSPVVFPDIALDVFLQIATHSDRELQLLLLEYIDEIHTDFRRPILRALRNSAFSEVSDEAGEALVVHGGG